MTEPLLVSQKRLLITTKPDKPDSVAIEIADDHLSGPDIAAGLEQSTRPVKQKDCASRFSSGPLNKQFMLP